MKEVEIWKPVVGFEGLYEVSNLGRVKSLEKRRRNGYCWATRRERIMKPAPVKTGGHLLVSLGGRSLAVHRMVLEAFVGPCPPGMEARHFPDRDPSNNKASNLSWGTKQQQYQDRVAHGTDAKTLWAQGRNGNQWSKKKVYA